MTAATMLAFEADAPTEAQDEQAIARLQQALADRGEVRNVEEARGMYALAAAADVATETPQAFSLIHAGKDGIKQVPGDSFVGAMEEQVEIR